MWSIAIPLVLLRYHFSCVKVKLILLKYSTSSVCLVTQLCLTLCYPMDCSLTGSSVLGGSPDKNTRVGCHALLQGIFLTKGSNLGLMHCRQIFYCLHHQGSPITYSVIPFLNTSDYPKRCVQAVSIGSF